MTEHKPIFRFVILLVLQLTISEVIADKCGIVEFIDPKILDGQQTTRGSWPFIVALYYTETSKFFCGGTLISSRNILTAAHCVHQKNSAHKLSPEDVIVLLGAYNLETKIERGTQQRNVENIYIHPDWKAFNDKFDADLAVFEMSDIVVFTNLIRPVCLPDANEMILDEQGWIVGWGLAENTEVNNLKHELIPRQAATRSLNDTYCFTTNHLLALFSSSRTFCGGGEGGTPNKGDSGGGFFVFSGSAWFQYGIISAALSDNTGRVSANSLSIYTNVKHFRSWIDDIVDKSGLATTTLIETAPSFGEVSESNDSNGRSSGVSSSSSSYFSASSSVMTGQKEGMGLTCTYDLILDVNYRCTLRDLKIEREDTEVSGFMGAHLNGKSAQDVSEIWFWTGRSAYIPRGIGKYFANLEKFMVSSDDINLGLKSVTRFNFENMHSLSYMNLRSNDIHTIDEDTLFDLPNLKDFIINNNYVKTLHENIFSRNFKLTTVYAISNKIEFLPRDLFKVNLLLEEAVFSNNKLVRISTDFTVLKYIKVVDFRGNVCINKDLHTVQSLISFQNIISNQCSSRGSSIDIS